MDGSGRERTPTKTDDTLDSDSDNGQSIPRTSKQIKRVVTATLSWFDSNNELLKANPFLIPNVLACLCRNSSTEALFKYRLVSHIWNELAVNVINQYRSEGVRLAKIVDTIRNTGITGTETAVVIDIKELISTLCAGKLKHSTLTRIFFNYSLTHNDLNHFLQLNGQNIRSLHYDGDSLEELRQILQNCAKNLKSLSLWRSWDENEGLFKNDNDEFKFPRLENLAIASGELSTGMRGIHFQDEVNNVCNPSKEFLSHIFRAAPNLKLLSARFYGSSILESGLSFKNLTTLCIKFKIRIPQLRALCHVGLKLKKLCLQGLFIGAHENENDYRYMDDPEWVEFRQVLLNFIQTQANTLEYFAVCLFVERGILGRITEHNSPHEQWSSRTGFPTMPHLRTFILYECSGKIPREEFGYLFPKLRNLDIVKCYHRQVAGAQQPNIQYTPSTSVQNIRGNYPTVEMARDFPFVTEFHIEEGFPVQLLTCWPKLKHLYYKDTCYYNEDGHPEVMASIGRINRFLIGITTQESVWIEEQGKRFGFDELTNFELPRSQPSIFDLNELETFEFKFTAYEFDQPFRAPGMDSALGVLFTLGLSRLTHLKKLNFVLEQKPRPNRFYTLPQISLDGFANTFSNRKDLTVGEEEDPRNPKTKNWTLKMNSDHHKSEWKEIDGLFRDDPDICDLGLELWVQRVDEDEDDEDDF